MSIYDMCTEHITFIQYTIMKIVMSIFRHDLILHYDCKSSGMHRQLSYNT